MNTLSTPPSAFETIGNAAGTSSFGTFAHTTPEAHIPDSGSPDWNNASNDFTRCCSWGNSHCCPEDDAQVLYPQLPPPPSDKSVGMEVPELSIPEPRTSDLGGAYPPASSDRLSGMDGQGERPSVTRSPYLPQPSAPSHGGFAHVQPSTGLSPPIMCKSDSHECDPSSRPYSDGTRSAWNSCVPYGNTQADRRNAHNKIWADLAAATSDCIEQSADTISKLQADARNKLEQYYAEYQATQNCDDRYAEYIHAHPSNSGYFHRDPYRPFMTPDEEMKGRSGAGGGSKIYRRGMYA